MLIDYKLVDQHSINREFAEWSMTPTTEKTYRWYMIFIIEDIQVHLIGAFTVISALVIDN